jgi:hypothetical protein
MKPNFHILTTIIAIIFYLYSWRDIKIVCNGITLFTYCKRSNDYTETLVDTYPINNSLKGGNIGCRETTMLTTKKISKYIPLGNLETPII